MPEWWPGLRCFVHVAVREGCAGSNLVAIIECHRLGSLGAANIYSLPSEMEKSKVESVLRLLFLVCRGCLLAVFLHDPRGKPALSGLFNRNDILFMYACMFYS